MNLTGQIYGDFSAPDEGVSTLIDLLRWRAASQPDRVVYSFLTDGESEDRSLTYRQLDQRAQAIAALLRSNGAPGDRALLLFPPGLDFVSAFFGCLYGGFIAIPAYPPHSAKLERSLPRLQTMARDSRPKFVLTTAKILHSAESVSRQSPEFSAMSWIATDTSELKDWAVDERWQAPAVSGDSVAFLQYTSGSTAVPKGVMVTHGNLLHNSSVISRCFDSGAESKGVTWLPPYHDMGLIGGVLQPLYVGGSMVMMSPAAFLQRPARWLEAISRSGATHSGGPNFAYELCVRKITEEQKAALDLSRWSVAFNGAEPIRHETQERFARAFEGCGFRREAFTPCYGMAEGTLLVSSRRLDSPLIYKDVLARPFESNRVVQPTGASETVKTLASCGQPAPEHRIEIVDPESLVRCRPDEVGEIWVSSPSVAVGYWNNSADTERTFQACLADTGEGPFLRTGDLGFILNGELFVTGRVKDMIILCGRNVYPQDLEITIERCHPALRPCSGAAFSIFSEGDERLVVVQELDFRQAPDPQDVMIAVRKAVAEEHELQVYDVVLIKPGTIPKTSSGKIQRHLCRAKYLEGSLDQQHNHPSQTMKGNPRIHLAGPESRVPVVSETSADRNLI